MSNDESVVDELTYEKYIEARKACLAMIDSDNSKSSRKEAQKAYSVFLIMVCQYPQNFGFKGRFQAVKALKAYDKKYNKELKGK